MPEVSAAKDILQSMEARTFGPEIISCPTCGRTQVDLIPIAEQVSKALRGLDAQSKWLSWAARLMALVKQGKQISELPAGGEEAFCSHGAK